MGCIYTLFKDGKESMSFKSYLELVGYLKNSDAIAKETITSIVYSKESTDKMESTRNTLLSLKEKFIIDRQIKEVASTDMENTDPEFDGHLSTLSFIDHDSFLFHNERVIAQKRDIDYKKNLIAEIEAENNKLETDLKLTPEEIEVRATAIMNNHNIINEDAKEIHSILNSNVFNGMDSSTFVTKLANTRFASTAASIYALMSNEVFGKMRGAHKLSNNKTGLIRGLNLAADLNYLDEEIIGHFDNIVIDDDGQVHIYNYKWTHTTVADWKSVKWEKYKYQMALLSLILAFNGIDVSKSSLHIIPIKGTYNEDFSEITDITIGNAITITNDSTFNKYRDMAKYHIKSNVIINPLHNSSLIKINHNLNRIFPDRTVATTGIQLSVDEWIKDNFSSQWLNRIKKVDRDDCVYELYLDEDFVNFIPITDSSKPTNNPQIRELVEKHIKASADYADKYLQRIINDIRVSKNAGVMKFSSTKGTSMSQQATYSYIENTLAKYILETEEKHGITRPVWDLISNETLHDSNILLFKNYKTELIDVIVLSNYDLRTKLHFKGRNNIMGSYITDTSSDTRGLVNYPASFGNIEIVRVMAIINETLPELNQQDAILGEIKVISTRRSGQTTCMSMERANKELFLEVVRVTKKNNVEFDLQNNFTKTKYIDPIDILIQDYNALMSTSALGKADADSFRSLGILNLESVQSRELKKVALRDLIEAIYKEDPVIRSMSAKQVTECAKRDTNKTRRALANLYIEAQVAYCYYSGINVNNEYKISLAEANVLKQNRVPNVTYNTAINIYRDAVDSYAYQVRLLYHDIEKFTIEFYDAQGYGKVSTSVTGTLSKAYANLYRVDSAGNRLMEFRNPYELDNLTPLSNAEKKYLKQVLFQFAKYKSRIYGFDFGFTSNDIDTKEYIDFIELNKRWYFLVPLEKASKATRRTKGLGHMAQEWKLKAGKFLESINGGDPKAWINELINNIHTTEEVELYEQGLESLTLYNPFVSGDGYSDISARNERIKEHGVEFFETNVENILAHYIEKEVQTRELNKALISIKGMLLSIELLGDMVGPNNKDGLLQTEKLIRDYVKLNMFNQSIMEPQAQKVNAWLKPFRELVSRAYISGNIVSMFRDIFEGMWQNAAVVATLFGTDITANDLKKAYAKVTSASFTSIRNITIIDELCKSYRLSNQDVARIAEGLTTSRGGIMNAENWLYQSLRAPDFLNRMTLFIAKCMKDGCYDAFSLENNKLVYNWRLDKRYSIYASGNKSHPEYETQRIAYYNAIRTYNMENPDLAIEFSEDLPVAYSNVQIKNIREVSDKIYGAYDKSMQANYSNLAIGINFAMFSTWMNGIVTNYWSKPGQWDSGYFIQEQDTTGSGNLLFMDKNGVACYEVIENGNNVYYYEATNDLVTDLEGLVPIMKNIPLPVQGIILTFGAAVNALRIGGWELVKKDVWANPVERANIKKALNDLLMSMLFYMLFKFALAPLYSNYKENMTDTSLAENAMMELLYKSSSRSYDSFMGPLNVIQYLGDNTSPPAYGLSLKIAKDLGKTITGDLAFSDLIFSNIAITRGFKHTRIAENKKNN